MAETGHRLRAVLDGYAKFLRDKDLALPKHQPYLVRWVREFLHLAGEHSGYTFEQTLRTRRVSHRSTTSRSIAGCYEDACQRRLAEARAAGDEACSEGTALDASLSSLVGRVARQEAHERRKEAGDGGAGQQHGKGATENDDGLYAVPRRAPLHEPPPFPHAAAIALVWPNHVRRHETCGADRSPTAGKLSARRTFPQPSKRPCRRDGCWSQGESGPSGN